MMKNEYEIHGDYVVIKVKGYGKIHNVLVSLEDFDIVSAIKNRWYMQNWGGVFYPYYQPYINGKRSTVMLHQFLMGTFGCGRDGKIVVDHINRNTLDNRRSNLQVTTQKVNVRKAKIRSDNKTGHKHIQWQEGRQKYRVELCLNKTYKFVGRYKTLEEAIVARDNALADIQTKED